MHTKNESERKMLGMTQEEYNKESSAHIKANILMWLIGGIIFSIYSNKLISFPTLLLFIPGIFIISLASIPTFYVEIKKRQILAKTNNLFVLLFFTVWYLIDLAYPIILSIIYISLINYLF
jgi:hypothetical protein